MIYIPLSNTTLIKIYIKKKSNPDPFTRLDLGFGLLIMYKKIEKKKEEEEKERILKHWPKGTSRLRNKSWS
jgi:hypothetical protein